MDFEASLRVGETVYEIIKGRWKEVCWSGWAGERASAQTSQVGAAGLLLGS